MGLVAGAVSTDFDVKIGQLAFPQVIQQQGGVLKDENIQNYVASVAARLIPYAPTKLPYRIFVLDTNVMNAFALPGGLLFVTRGILKSLSNEAELAFVVAHEIAHAAQRHGVKQILSGKLKEKALAWFSGKADGEFEKQLAAAGAAMAQATYGREHESESDEHGFKIFTAAGYHPKAAAAALTPFMGGAKKSTVQKWMSSHPITEDRVRTLQALAAGLPDSGELGVVCEQSKDAQERPKVCVITDSARNRLEEITTAELTEADEDGKYLRSVADTIDPMELDIDVLEILQSVLQPTPANE